MSSTGKLRSRYELKEVISKGGMGVIYKAYDTLMKREVALKTILDVRSQSAAEMFRKEWALQASVIHPNVVEIYDIGDFEENGVSKPYFVMPLLPGLTLGQLIRGSSHRLTVERCIDIICQTCRGLQAAHEKGLVHRDLKPSNIFVMDDDSVKIIDFGIVYSEDGAATDGMKGTLPYMAPELLQMKQPSTVTDIFALGAVSYEALTLRRAFQGATDAETSKAILYFNPPPASEINKSVSQMIGRVVHKAMAKQPWHRYSTAREFGETLAKALRNEPIEFFDPAKVLPRMERASRAFERGEYQVAAEMLSELEGEGHIDQEITHLRRQIEQATRQVNIRQLLESSQRFFEEEEYSLALRKIHEALQLDPNDANALALKGQVETKRREKKIDEWSQLARRHLDNNAFPHARSAIQSLLELKANDTSALEMLAEIDRREQDFDRVRGEKSTLYDTAVDAWQRGEVTAALSRLERWALLAQNAPDTDGARLLSCQNFYNQVRSEHEAIKNSYDEARKQLADGNFAEALALCEQYLAKYPGHALFQALKFDVEERQRQNLSAFIAATDRQVDSEPDLGKRCNILEAALKMYPGEAHFERAFKLTRDKRDLVNSVVGKAHLHEEQSHYSEAMDQWEILRAIHGQYPGLEYEMERLRQRRDSQSRSDAKSDWTKQVDRYLESRDYARALQAARKGLVEFPQDAELSELEKLARQKVERASEAMRLLARGGELCQAGKFDEGLDTMRGAYRLDEGNTVVRTVLADTLAARAKSLLTLEQASDLASADGLISEILDLDPNHSLGKNLRATALDKKREEFLSWCMGQARRLQAAGDLEGARAVVQQGQVSYPQDSRLKQLLATLDRALEDLGGRQSRDRDLEFLKRLEQDSRPVTDKAQAGVLQERTKAIASQYKADPEFQALAGAIEQRVAALQSPPPPPSITDTYTTAITVPAGLKSPVVPAEPPPLHRAMDESLFGMAFDTTSARGRVQPGESPIEKPPVKPLDVQPPTPPPVVTVPVPPKPPRKSFAALLALGPNKNLPRNLGIGGAVLLLLAAGVYRMMHRPVVLPTPIHVEIRTTPTGAMIRIDGKERGPSNLQFDLPAGTYRLSAELDGYGPAATTFEAKSGAPVALDLTLPPLTATLKVYTDAEGSEAWLDEKPLGLMREGEFSNDAIVPGTHTFRLASKKGQVSTGFELAPGKLPAASALQANGLNIALVNQFGGRVWVYCNCAPAKASLDNRALETLGVTGLEWSGVTPGAHEIKIVDALGERKLAIQGSAAQLVTAFIFAKPEPNTGTLTLLAGEENVTVFINNKPYRQQTQKGQLRIPNLLAGRYAVRLAKDGYEPAPEQIAIIVKGADVKLQFQLRQAVKMASLQLRGAAAGARVLMDGAALGVVQPDGTFTAEVVPGDHSIELRKDPARSKPVSKRFAAGQPVQIPGAELAMERPPGTIRFRVSPQGARVTIRLQNEPESQAKVVSQDSMSLPEGTYVVSLNAPDYKNHLSIVPLAAGGTATVEVALQKREAPAPVVIKSLGMADWESKSWTQDGGWFVHRGGNFVPFHATPVDGTFSFLIELRKGKRLQWYVNRVDDRNYIAFRLDKKSFYREQYVNGKSAGAMKIAHGLDKEDSYSLRIDVGPDRVVHSIKRGDNWSGLDSWNQPGKGFDRGQFGLFIPGRDEFAIRNFSFTPRAH